MPTSAASTETAREAWGLIWRIFIEDKPRRWAILSELGLSLQQSMALSHLEPGVPQPMGVLAEAMHCDNSNITGIVDRLEAAGLAERRPSERDRRVKAIVLTPKGERMRAEVMRRGGEPPPALAALPEEDAVALRDILARAVDR
jgi:MarR family transcriptional regulator, organic hydroperoxide resistance regulator